MSDIIYPRSSLEVMCGWMHLPRYIDKIRLHLAGKLHPDYQENLGKGFDELAKPGLVQVRRGLRRRLCGSGSHRARQRYLRWIHAS